MNDTAAALGNQGNSIFSNVSFGVVVLLAIVALLAAVTIAGIVYGAHQKRRRLHAEAEVIEHADEERQASGEDGGPASGEPSSATPRPVPSPAPAEPVGARADAMAVEAETPLADEPIAATDAATANPAIEAGAGVEDAANVPRASMADHPVTTLKGLGPKVAAQLNALGVATVGDLAALDDRAAQDLDARLGAFTGRMGRDRWLEQARLLAAGDRKGFEERFGKL